MKARRGRDEGEIRATRMSSSIPRYHCCPAVQVAPPASAPAPVLRHDNRRAQALCSAPSEVGHARAQGSVVKLSARLSDSVSKGAASFFSGA